MTFCKINTLVTKEDYKMKNETLDALELLNTLTNLKIKMGREIGQLLEDVKNNKYPDFSYDHMKANIEMKYRGAIEVAQKRWDIKEDEIQQTNLNYNLTNPN